MNKQDIVNALYDHEDLSLTRKQASQALDAVLGAITDALANGEKVSIIGFGTFETRHRAAREGTNPQTKEKIQIAAKTVAAFKPGKTLRDSVDN